MTRVIQMIGGCALAILLGLLAYDFVVSPVKPMRLALNNRLKEIPPVTGSEDDQRHMDLSRLQKVIAAKPTLWKELVAPPPPAVAKPDLAKILQGVRATREQIGDKVKLNVPGNSRGEYVAKGDGFRGLTVKAVTPQQVVFSLNQGGREYTLALPRQ